MIDPIRRLGGALTISVLAITLVACGGTTPSGAATASPAGAATPAPASETPSAPGEASPSEAAEATPGGSLATTGRIEVADKGFAVTLPDGWTRVDVTEEAIAAAIAASELDPALAAQYSAQIKALLGAGLAVFAFGPDPTAGTQLTVLALPSMGMSLDLLEQVNEAQLESLAQGDIQTERITLPAGEAIHYRYSLGGEGTPSATLDQYFILAGDNQLVVTATNATEADAAAIANSVENLD
jgi:hypothetical protein